MIHSPFQGVANASAPLASAPFPATIQSPRTLTKGPKSAQDMEGPMLQVPLEIAFHNIASSQGAEQEIRARVADLERLYPRLVSCRVRIDQRAKDLTGTIPPVVHIELGIPGRSAHVASSADEHHAHKREHFCAYNATN